MVYVATFFSHFAAVKFARDLEKISIECKLMAVPRRLSSSCGTCVQFTTDMDVKDLAGEGVDKIFSVEQHTHSLVFDNN
mgnify:CR=1 FL=1